MSIRKIKNIIKEFLPELFLSLAGSFLLFVYGTVEVFYVNSYELFYSIIDVIQYMLPLFLAAVFVMLGILILLKNTYKKIEFIIFLLSFAGLIVIYIQGTFLSSNLPPLNGSEIKWGEYRNEIIKSIILFVVIVGIVFFVYYLFGEKKIRTIIKMISAFLFSMLFLTSIYYFIESYGRNEKETYCTNEKLLEMSEDSNLIIFLADQVDAEVFSNIAEIHPEYYEYFKDFTFFCNTMSGYPWTLRSIPLILSGQWFENEQSDWDYVQEAMSSSPLFSYLKSHNYNVGFYNPEYTFSVEGLKFENIAKRNEYFTYPIRFIKMQIKLSGYRYLPFFLKRFCFLSTDDFYFDTLKSDEYSSYSTVNSDFCNTINKQEVTITSDKCFKFLYILGAHDPFTYKAEAEGIEDFSYESSIEKTISTFLLYINKLKESKVYDNTAIIFMSDHGYAPDVRSGVGRQNPILFVKGINEHHPLEFSDVPVSHADLVEKYPELAEGGQSTEVFSYVNNEKRSRRYLLYAFGEEHIMHEFYQWGNASDEKTMVATGKIYSR